MVRRSYRLRSWAGVTVDGDLRWWVFVASWGHGLGGSAWWESSRTTGGWILLARLPARVVRLRASQRRRLGWPPGSGCRRAAARRAGTGRASRAGRDRLRGARCREARSPPRPAQLAVGLVERRRARRHHRTKHTALQRGREPLVLHRGQDRVDTADRQADANSRTHENAELAVRQTPERRLRTGGSPTYQAEADIASRFSLPRPPA